VVDIKYNKLKVLIADDFSNFRATIQNMLMKIGIYSVDAAANADEIIDHCRRGKYDIILCDYDLGVGKTGHQVLEELHFHSLLKRSTLFLIVSAESSKDIVMASYDCEPDDYLMKPITAKMLQKRLKRLLLQREALLPVYKALDKGDASRAIGFLTDMSISDNRYSVIAQKLLGEMFVEQGELGKAEKLYSRALDDRQLDWARLGLAKVKQLKGELDTAEEWLEKLVEENPLYLPAYDSLAENCARKGNVKELQRVVQKSVGISPMSILRQKKLADVAEKNGDLSTAIEALRHSIKLGERSCFATADDNFSFARVASSTIENNLAPPQPLGQETLSNLDLARSRFSLSSDQSIRADLMEGRVHALSGDIEKATEIISSVESAVGRPEDTSLELNMDRIRALQTLGDNRAADALLRELLEIYAYDQDALESLDTFLSEPVSENNRARIAQLNREGIDLYEQQLFDEAIECFEKVLNSFPRHVGVLLNIVQALLGKTRMGADELLIQERVQSVLNNISELIQPGHSQYNRYQKLHTMAMDTIPKNGTE